jgi:hypothetical protein
MSQVTVTKPEDAFSPKHILWHLLCEKCFKFVNIKGAIALEGDRNKAIIFQVMRVMIMMMVFMCVVMAMVMLVSIVVLVMPHTNVVSVYWLLASIPHPKLTATAPDHTEIVEF